VRTRRFTIHLGLAKTNADSPNSALELRRQLLDRALVLGAQRQHPHAQCRRQAEHSIEVQGYRTRLLAISRTAVQAVYLQRRQDSGPAYEQDLTSPNGVTRLLNVELDTADGRPAGVPSRSIRARRDLTTPVMPTTPSRPATYSPALNNLRTALLNNDSIQIPPPAARSNGIRSPQYLAGFYGAVQNRIQNATSYGASYDVQLKTELAAWSTPMLPRPPWP